MGRLLRCRGLRRGVRGGRRRGRRVRGRAQQPRLPRDFGAQVVVRHAVVGIAGGTDVNLLRGVEAPDLARIGQRLPGFVEIAGIAVLVLDDDLGDGRPRTAGAALRLPLAAARGVGFALFPGAHRFGKHALESQGVSRLLPTDGLSQFAQHARLEAREQLGHRRLTDAQLRGDLMLRPAEDGQFHRPQLPRAHSRAGFMAALPASTTSTTRGIAAHLATFRA